MAPGQLAQVPVEACHREALQACVERGGNARWHRGARRQLRARIADQSACEVRGKLLPHGGRRRRGVALRHRPGTQQRQLREAFQPFALARQPHVAQDAAGPARHLRGGRVGRAHQRHRQRRFARIEPFRVLAEQHLRQRRQPDQFAAERHQVQVRLEDLVLAPAAFQHRRARGLADLLREAAPLRRRAGPAQVVVQQSGQLHGQRRGAARTRVPQVGPRRRSHALPVDAAMRIEALVFRQHDGRAQGRRSLRQRDPVAAARAEVVAYPADHVAVAVQHGHVGAAPVVAHLREGRQRGGVAAPQQRRQWQQQRQPGQSLDAPRHDSGRSDTMPATSSTCAAA
ncbi:hypothetical protein D9M70_403420 [compost metagenome]